MASYDVARNILQARCPGADGAAPGVATGIAATLVIMLSTFSALGISGLLVSAGVKFTALTLQVVPFLALGLGINDYFVLATYVTDAIAAAPPGGAAATHPSNVCTSCTCGLSLH